eukprot:1139334-Pelagomonas_calceolata.AAC.17
MQTSSFCPCFNTFWPAKFPRMACQISSHDALLPVNTFARHTQTGCSRSCYPPGVPCASPMHICYAHLPCTFAMQSHTGCSGGCYPPCQGTGGASTPSSGGAAAAVTGASPTAAAPACSAHAGAVHEVRGVAGQGLCVYVCVCVRACARSQQGDTFENKQRVGTCFVAVKSWNFSAIGLVCRRRWPCCGLPQRKKKWAGADIGLGAIQVLPRVSCDQTALLTSWSQIGAHSVFCLPLPCIAA